MRLLPRGRRMAARPAAAADKIGTSMLPALQRLPPEVMCVAGMQSIGARLTPGRSVQILSFLKPEEVAKFSMVCRELRRYAPAAPYIRDTV